MAEVKPPPNDPPKCDGGQEGPPKEPSVAPQKPDHKSEVIPSQNTNPVAPLKASQVKPEIDPPGMGGSSTMHRDEAETRALIKNVTSI